MPSKGSERNPLALTALVVCVIPLLSTLSMLGLKYGVGPQAALYAVASVSGFLLFGLVVMGSGLAMVSLLRAPKGDLRAYFALASLVLSMLLFSLFAR